MKKNHYLSSAESYRCTEALIAMHNAEKPDPATSRQELAERLQRKTKVLVSEGNVTTLLKGVEAILGNGSFDRGRLIKPAYGKNNVMSSLFGRLSDAEKEIGELKATVSLLEEAVQGMSK